MATAGPSPSNLGQGTQRSSRHYLALRAEEQLQNEENQFVPKSVRDTMSQFDKKQQKPHAKALYANQRDRLKQMVLDSSVGHVWQYTRGEKATNLQLKCAVCDLWIQQGAGLVLARPRPRSPVRRPSLVLGAELGSPQLALRRPRQLGQRPHQAQNNPRPPELRSRRLLKSLLKPKQGPL